MININISLFILNNWKVVYLLEENVHLVMLKFYILLLQNFSLLCTIIHNQKFVIQNEYIK